MTPRHPPRALRSLTTPIRPPRFPGGNSTAGPARGQSPISLFDRVPGVSRRGAALIWVTIPIAGRSLRSERTHASVRVHCSWRDLDSCHYHSLAWLSCLRDLTTGLSKSNRTPTTDLAAEARSAHPRDPALAAGQGARPRTALPRTQQCKQPTRASTRRNPSRERASSSVDRVRGRRTFVGSRRKNHLTKETVPMRPF